MKRACTPCSFGYDPNRDPVDPGFPQSVIAASNAINWKALADHYTAEMRSRIYPDFDADNSRGLQSRQLDNVKLVLTKHPELNYYFNPQYADISYETDDLLITQVVTNPLLWQMVVSGNYGSPSMIGTTVSNPSGLPPVTGSSGATGGAGPGVVAKQNASQISSQGKKSSLLYIALGVGALFAGIAAFMAIRKRK